MRSFRERMQSDKRKAQDQALRNSSIWQADRRRGSARNQRNKWRKKSPGDNWDLNCNS